MKEISEPPSGEGKWFRVLGGAEELDFEASVRVSYDDDGHAVIEEVRLSSSSGLIADQMTKLPLGTVRRLLSREAVPDRPEPIRRTRGDSEGFLRQVERHYRYHLGRTRAPARAIAAEHDVPVTTVHRWIREARKAGLLPKGQQGRAG